MLGVLLCKPGSAGVSAWYAEEAASGRWVEMEFRLAIMIVLSFDESWLKIEYLSKSDQRIPLDFATN